MSVRHRQTHFTYLVHLLRRWAVPNVDVIGRRPRNAGPRKVRAVEISKTTVTGIDGKRVNGQVHFNCLGKASGAEDRVWNAMVTQTIAEPPVHPQPGRLESLRHHQ